MKNYNLILLSILSTILFTSNAFSQNLLSSKIEIYTGFGFQQYNGDLGNGFFNRNNVTYGVASLGVNYKINNSFGIKLQGTVGDFGYCQERDIIINRVPMNDGHNGHDSDKDNVHYAPEEENFSSRLFTGVLGLQFNFANGYVLPIESKYRPYVYLGIGINKLTDIMEMECVNVGNYSTTNAGFGLQYQAYDKFSIGCSFGFGMFHNDAIDFVSNGRGDMYMKNSATIAYCL